MRGVLVHDGGVEVVDDLELRPPGPREVVVRVVAAGVCHSDLHVLDGIVPWPRPCVLGHEGAGVVEEVGAAVTALAPGDTVVTHVLANCGMCAACETGRPGHCRAGMDRMRSAQPFSWRGQDVYQFANTSVFAERTLLHETQAVRIDDGIPFTSACLLGCAVLTGVGAVVNRARVAAGDSVAVFGVGGIGLNVVQGARLVGAERIVAIDANPGKEDLARAFGATDFVDASSVDPVDGVRALCPDGVRHSFECVGAAAVARAAVDVLAWGGGCVIVGVPRQGTEISFPIGDIYMDKAVMGCRYGTSRPHHDIPMLADLSRSGRLELDALVSQTYALEDVATAMADLRAGRVARGVLEIGDPPA